MRAAVQNNANVGMPRKMSRVQTGDIQPLCTYSTCVFTLHIPLKATSFSWFSLFSSRMVASSTCNVQDMWDSRTACQYLTKYNIQYMFNHEPVGCLWVTHYLVCQLVYRLFLTRSQGDSEVSKGNTYKYPCIRPNNPIPSIQAYNNILNMNPSKNIKQDLKLI